MRNFTGLEIVNGLCTAVGFHLDAVWLFSQQKKMQWRCDESLLLTYKALVCMALGVISTLCTSAHAGVSVDRIRVDLDKSQTLYFSNTGDQAVRYEVVVSAWSSAGEVTTRDILVYPPVIQIPPNGKQAVKLVAKVTPTENQGTYRLLFKAVEGAGLGISIPVFIPSNRPDAKPQVMVRRAGADIELVNAGPVTERITQARTGTTWKGMLVYVLPHSTALVRDSLIDEFRGDNGNYPSMPSKP
jgi:P pilus assembly chaperone PapD